MEVDEGSDQKSDIKPHRMAAHVRLKNEFTEDEKCHHLMRWLVLFLLKTNQCRRQLFLSLFCPKSNNKVLSQDTVDLRFISLRLKSFSL